MIPIVEFGVLPRAIECHVLFRALEAMGLLAVPHRCALCGGDSFGRAVEDWGHVCDRCVSARNPGAPDV